MELKKTAKNYLDKSKQHYGNETIQTVIKGGDFGQNILNVATEMNVDIIVMELIAVAGWIKYYWEVQRKKFYVTALYLYLSFLL